MLPHGLCNYLCSLNPNLACRDEAYEAFPDSHVTRDLVAMIPAHDMRNEPKLPSRPSSASVLDAFALPQRAPELELRPLQENGPADREPWRGHALLIQATAE